MNDGEPDGIRAEPDDGAVDIGRQALVPFVVDDVDVLRDEIDPPLPVPVGHFRMQRVHPEAGDVELVVPVRLVDHELLIGFVEAQAVLVDGVDPVAYPVRSYVVRLGADDAFTKEVVMQHVGTQSVVGGAGAEEEEEEQGECQG